MSGAVGGTCGLCTYCYYDPISSGSLCMIPRPPKPVERSHACQSFRPKTRSLLS
ncbi:MAG: hypothetical protein AABX40_04750 [Candidatus Hydrothermarchaeota archaeon]